jgi:pimeloyl-ACP methyl ester carboxylesterase
MNRRQALIGGVGLAVIAAGAVSWLYSRELGQARQAAGRGSLIANLDVGPIEYAERGAGVPLLSIHGAGGDFDQGLANAAELVGEGFRIVAPSRFGYLRTPVPQDVSPAAQADAHAALLAELDIPKAIILGVSAGARSAVELALRRPDRVSALILMVPGLYSPTSPVSIEASRGSKFAFWAVNVGGDFAWWAAETIAPSTLVRFLGVPPQLVAAASPAERDRVMSTQAGRLRHGRTSPGRTRPGGASSSSHVSRRCGHDLTVDERRPQRRPSSTFRLAPGAPLPAGKDRAARVSVAPTYAAAARRSARPSGSARG